MDADWFSLVRRARNKQMNQDLLRSKQLNVVAQCPIPEVADFNSSKKGVRHGDRIVMLGESHPGIYLTEREAHVGLHLLRGCTCNEAARQMNLSRRTVEYYVGNIKTKLGTRRKSNIVSALLASDFIRNFNYLTSAVSIDERAKMAEKV